MDDPIRLLVAHYQSNIVSGAELAIADLFDKLDPRFDGTMLVPTEGKLADSYRQRGFQVWVKNVETRRRIFPGLHTFQSLFFAQALRNKNIDIVLCNTFSTASRVGTASRMAGRPYAIYVREYIQDRPLHRKILKQADLIFAVSADLQQYLSKFTDPTRIRLAYDNIDPKPVYAKLASHNASGIRLVPFGGEHPIVGMVGRITRYKQQDLFLRAIPLILSEVPEARFIVVGEAQKSEQDYEVYIKKLAGELGITGKVAFMGYRKDSVEITSEFTVSCLTSTREPLGRVILEAQLVGCPVVASNTGGSPETIEDGVTGLLFPAAGIDAVERLAEKVIYLLKDRSLRDGLAQRARSRVADTFAGQKHVRIQETYIEELSSLKSKRGGR